MRWIKIPQQDFVLKTQGGGGGGGLCTNLRDTTVYLVFQSVSCFYESHLYGRGRMQSLAMTFQDQEVQIHVQAKRTALWTK